MDSLSTKAILRLEQVNLFTKLKTQIPGNQQGYPILQNISFDVFPGDRLVIVGSTGAGKTSLLRLLNRLIVPSSGKIHLDNQEYHQIPIMELRQQITLVLQESKLLGMTVEEALAYPLVLRGWTQPKIQTRINYWMEKLQIPPDWLKRTEVQISAGQRQLVAIARALVIQPKILLLDEPTSALDTATANLVVEVLTQLNQTDATTILMVNHQLETAQTFCQRVLYLQQGQLLINQPASAIDWADLHNNLLQAEVETSQEWG